MDLSSIKAVLFDLDGTLIDSAPDLGAAAEKMRIQRGMPALGLSAYRHMAGAGARGMLGIAFGITPEASGYENLKNEFLSNYQAAMTVHTREFDGVTDMLQAVSARRLVWGIVTNKAERFTLPLVRELRVLQGAQVVVGGDTTAHAKPHPEPLFEAARRLGIGPQNCLYVGDDERDIVAGRAAGMPTVAALYGYLGLRSDVVAWGADFSVDHPSQVLKLLDVA